MGNGEVVGDRARLPIEPLVSVFMTTYNHERFTQALDGILMQEVDFPYEIVIGETSPRIGPRRS